MTRSLREPSPPLWPTSLPELEPGERLVVWSLRRWASGQRENAAHHQGLVWNEFARQFGTTVGKSALQGFIGITVALQEYGRRLLRHHQPCCPCLGADEVWLVNLVGACQRGEFAVARRLAEWAVHPDGAGALLAASQTLARAMRAHELDLPDRTTAGRPVGGVAVTIH